MIVMMTRFTIVGNLTTTKYCSKVHKYKKIKRLIRLIFFFEIHL